jgi:hypothetical protein
MKGKDGKERWGWLLHSNDMIPHPLSLSLLLLLHSNQPQTCILGWHLQQQFVCFFLKFVFPSLCETGSICRTHLESHLCQFQSIMNLTQKTQWPQQRVRPGQPASQPAREVWNELSFHPSLSNPILSSCYVGGHLSQSVCPYIHPSRKDHNCKMRVCQYVWTRIVTQLKKHV